MSSTRLICASLEEAEAVKPTKALGVLSMPCEIQAAAISTRTKQAINEKNDEMIGFRYIQNRAGEKNTAMHAMLFSYVALFIFMSLIILHSNEDETNETTFFLVYRFYSSALLLFLFYIPSLIYCRILQIRAGINKTKMIVRIF